MPRDDEHADDCPPWDEDFAQTLLGSRVLIGLTYCDASGRETGLEQLHGIVVEADRNHGIGVRLEGAHEGETKSLPPHTGAFEIAGPGVYTLRTTGEQVVDPDYLATWTITART
jgi:hypothetical protein